MRFEEFVLRVPGDEFRIRFHENLTVLAGVGANERRALVDSILGALTGDADGAMMQATDHTGRRVELTALGGQVRARYLDDEGGSAPTPIGWFAPDAETLRSLLVITAEDVGCTARIGRADDSPAIAEARAALWSVDDERQAALDARDAVEAALIRMAELDSAIRVADQGAARRAYAIVVGELEKVRAEAEAVRSTTEAPAVVDRELLIEAAGLQRLAERWFVATDAADGARIEALGDDQIDPHDIAWLVDVPTEVPADLPSVLRAATEAERDVQDLQDGLHEVATASLPAQADPRVVTLASVDQGELWRCRDRLIQARADLENERLRVGGMGDGPPSSAVEAMEEAHARWEAADRIVEERRVIVVGGGALLALLALPAAGLAGPFVVGLILIAVLGGVYAFLGRPGNDRAAAARDEQRALLALGAPSYLSFHMRRIDVSLDPSNNDRLELAEAEMRLADRAWAAVAGPIGFSEANELEPAVRTFVAQIGSRHGAVEELGALRRVLEHERIPAAAVARQAALDAVAPYGMDADDLAAVEPEVVVAQLAAMVGLGAAARRRQAVLDAEAEEQEAAHLLDEVLVRLGYDDGALGARLEAASWTIEKARDRDAARAASRPLAEIDEDLERLAAEARQQRRPEFAGVTAADAVEDTEVEALRAERDQLSASLTEHEQASADLERLSERRGELPGGPGRARGGGCLRPGRARRGGAGADGLARPPRPHLGPRPPGRAAAGRPRRRPRRRAGRVQVGAHGHAPPPRREGPGALPHRRCLHRGLGPSPRPGRGEHHPPRTGRLTAGISPTAGGRSCSGGCGARRRRGRR